MNKLIKLFLLLCVSLTLLSSSCEDEIPEPVPPPYLKTGNFFDCAAGENISSYDDIKDIKTKAGSYIFKEGQNLRIANDLDFSSAAVIKNYDDLSFSIALLNDYEFFGDDVLIADNGGLSLYERTTGDSRVLIDAPVNAIEVQNGQIYFSVPGTPDYNSRVVYKYSLSDDTYEEFIDDVWLSGTFVMDFDFDPQGNLLVKDADNRFFRFDEEGNNTFFSVNIGLAGVSLDFNTKYTFEGEDMYFATLNPQVGFQLLRKRGDQTKSLVKILKETDDEQDEQFIPFHVLGDIVIREGKLYAGLQESLASECMGLFVFDITSEEELGSEDYYILTEEGRDSQCISDIIENEDGEIIYISDGKVYRADCG